MLQTLTDMHDMEANGKKVLIVQNKILRSLYLTAITEYYRLDDQTTQLCNSGSWKSKIKELAGMVSGETFPSNS